MGLSAEPFFLPGRITRPFRSASAEKRSVPRPAFLGRNLLSPAALDKRAFRTIKGERERENMRGPQGWSWHAARGKQ